MNKLIPTLLISSFLLGGCQKAPEATPEKAVEPAPAEETGADVKSDASAEAVVLPNDAAFASYGLDTGLMTPPFSKGVATKNGTFALTKPGTFRIYLANDNDDAKRESEFIKYCEGAFNHIKTVSDEGKIYNYDVTSDVMQDEIDVIPKVSLTEPLSVSYKYKGKSVSVYINYKTYQPGALVDVNEPAKAVYVGVFEIKAQ